ncbi:hypothetical protein E34_0864 [Lactococcus lactis subsp. lactis]|nr:hypothetical protein E34_0864 [Lactococcus lactis subsp. lactis]KST84021.1 hypothetical protein LK337_1144 [Lactococcus lactis subsp. lactis]
MIKITDKDGKININAKKLLTEVLSVIFLSTNLIFGCLD